MKRPLLALTLALCTPSAAQDFGAKLDLSAGKAEMQARKEQQASGKAVCKGQGPDETCSCPAGQHGIRKLQVHLYAPINMEFIGDQKANAAWAYGKHANVLVRNVSSGSFGLMQSPARAKGGKDPEKGAPNLKIDAFDELCAVVKDAITIEPPKPNSIPVFFVILGEGFKKSIFTHINGINMPNGLQERCETVGVSGLPKSPLILVDLEPEQPHVHVLAHELGHAIGQASGDSKRFFNDMYDDTSENIMVSARKITREQMKLNQFQVKAVCASPYLADTL